MCVNVIWTQISSAYKNFGVGNDERSCVIAKLVNTGSDAVEMDDVCATVCGQQVPVSTVSEFNSLDRIKRVNRFYGTTLCWQIF